MSKSKGNVVEPQKVLDEYGADALRFWAAGAKLGEDLNYQEKDLVTGKKFATKLWNASRFAFMNLKGYRGKKPKKLEKIDDLFLTKINLLIQRTTEAFENYQYSKAKSDVERFFWHDFCDNYLEIIKKRIYQGKGNKKLSAQYTLYKSLLTILKLIAPIMPFITEDVYKTHFKKFEKIKSVHLAEWPKPVGMTQRKLDKVSIFTSLVDIISHTRRWKTRRKKPMNAEINLNIDARDYNKLKPLLQDLKDVTNAREIRAGKQFRVEFV